jgi:mannose-6-phosphate isomerase-like protein (cupin superfamily)
MELHHLDQLRREGQSYVEFLRRPDLSVGVYRLTVGQADLQQPHTEDEVYYIVRGRGKFQSGEQLREVCSGDVIFVPAHEPHRFLDVVEAMEVLVMFAPAEGARK